MCGRYVLSKPGDVIAETLESLEGFELVDSAASQIEARFNVAPTQQMPILRSTGLATLDLASASSARRSRSIELSSASWSFTSAKLNSRAAGKPLINARSETLLEKRSFATSFRQRRCLVPATGFYEWRPRGNRQPFFFRAARGSILVHGFCFAGLWQESVQRASSKSEIEFCIVTGKAGSSMTEIHHRRPVIVEPDGYRQWLDPATSEDRLLALLRDSDPPLERYPVSFKVNKVAYDGPELLAEVSEAPTNLTLF